MRLLATRLVLAGRRLRHRLLAGFARTMLSLVRLMQPDTAIRFVDGAARRIGPWTPRHRLALHNLALAFPEKSEAEREAIARGMWGNMARLAAEYVFLDEIFDFDPARNGEGRVEVEGIPTFEKLLAEQRPFIVFTAHTGNFELLPIAAAAFGIDVTVLFRAPNNPFIADEVLNAREGRMGRLVPSQAGASWVLARALDDGRPVGMLVDQKFRKGLKTTFFGHPARTSPLLPKLVRQFECEVYPARCIRLPDDRYRLAIEPAIPIQRTEAGAVDVQALAQSLNDKVESWVREYPDQWMWFHDRWGVKKTFRNGD